MGFYIYIGLLIFILTFWLFFVYFITLNLPANTELKKRKFAQAVSVFITFLLLFIPTVMAICYFFGFWELGFNPID
jgi:hypothetical protein